MNKASIAKWYDETSPFYRYIWYLNSQSYALHYGLWDRNTKNLHEALLNTNEFMSRQAGIKKGTEVLDAGCGIGGSSIWLAKNIQAKVTGISISSKQIEKANELAEKYGVSTLVTFYLKDYLHTEFKDNTFDVVWAIESVCHAKKKEAFLAEAYRILKKGGKIIISDGFLKRKPINKREKQLTLDFYRGMLLPNLSSFSKFENKMKSVGFIKLKKFDKTKNILPSSRRMNRITKILYPFLSIAVKISLLPSLFLINCKAAIVQYEGVKRGLFGYGIFYAEK